MKDHGNHIKSEEQEEEQEVFVVSVAKAVIHKNAVVVETLHTLVTIIAVHAVLRVQVLAIYANVVHVEVFFDQTFH